MTIMNEWLGGEMLKRCSQRNKSSMALASFSSFWRADWSQAASPPSPKATAGRCARRGGKRKRSTSRSIESSRCRQGSRLNPRGIDARSRSSG